MQRVGDNPTIATRMQVLRRGLNTQFKPCIAPRPDIQRHKIRPPPRAICGQYGVRGKQVSMGLQYFWQGTRPGFLFTFNQQLYIDGQLAFNSDKCGQCVERDHHWSLIIRDTAPVEPAIALGRIKWRCLPLVQRVRRLYVIMRIDQDCWCLRRIQAFCIKRGLATAVGRRQTFAIHKAHRVKARFDQLARLFHPRRHGRVGPDRRAGYESFQSFDKLWFVIEGMCKNWVAHRISFR